MWSDLLYLTTAVVLVFFNGFFVAAEFAFVKLRSHQLRERVGAGVAFAPTAKWLHDRLEHTLAACQLGITMASLGLGWVGEPAFARLLEPLLVRVGVDSPAVLHGVAFAFAFTSITVLHLVAGEQVPKIFALRQADRLALFCALPMKAFYVLAFPFLGVLSRTTGWILRLLGVKDADGHELPHSEEELRHLLRRSLAAGEISRTEHELADAVFAFDELISRRVMLPRSEVDVIDVSDEATDWMAFVQRTAHSRYPVCEGSLDNLLGVLHVKDLVGVPATSAAELRSLLRPAHRVPEGLPIGRLLQHFRATRQHMAFVVDEYGNVIGIVTLDHVLGEIVGELGDEFDEAGEPDVLARADGSFLARGGVALEELNEVAGTSLWDDEVETLSGLVTARLGRIPARGDEVVVDGVVLRVTEAEEARAARVLVRPPRPAGRPGPDGPA